MAIAWKSGFATTKDVDPEAALDALDEILERDGLLKPDAVVAAAEPKTSPLHPAFEWRNGVAANRYREWQARALIRSVRVVNDATGKDAPVFVAVVTETADGQARGYQRTEVAMARPDEWLSALSMFSAKISSARRSLEELEVMAAKTDNRDRLANIAIAAKALDMAHAALRQ